MKSLICWLIVLPPCSSFLIKDIPTLRRLVTIVHDISDRSEPPETSSTTHSSNRQPSRRTLLTYTAASLTLGTAPAHAAKKSVLRNNPSTLPDETVVTTGTTDANQNQLTSELCLLQLLPVKNGVLRTLEDYVVSLNPLRSQMTVDSNAIKNAQKRLESAIDYLDKNRRSLEPVFNAEDSAMFQIEKAERGERLIESFRTELSILLAYSKVQKVEELFARQKKALLALADIGELLVGSFPYDVPREGRFSFLPRLEGRCSVIFTFARGGNVLGNCTILADGFAAPITAGNFVDLSLRGFYTGLTVKLAKKRFGESRSPKSKFLAGFAESSLESLGIETPDQEVFDPFFPSKLVSLPLLGSYKEGFYDPLTAKPRRIPLEILRQDKSTGLFKLCYEEGFTLLSDSSVNTDQISKPVLSFETQGLVAFNHGERTLGSSEFFVLPDAFNSADERRLLNGQYSAFGYVIDGYDIIQSLKAGDVIAETTVGEFGRQNLVKIRGTSFSDVVQQGTEIE
jgi:peptidylprolyl isomerase